MVLLRYRSLAVSSAFVLAAAFVLWLPSPGTAGVENCRSRVARVAGSFAKKRGKQIVRCAASSTCLSGDLVAQLGKLRTRATKKLVRDCTGLAGTDLGLGSTCPDPTGRCTQVLDSQDSLVDCLFCVIAETIDPLVRRLQGSPADDAQTCGGCSATPCDPDLFCETRPGHCDDSTAVGICLEPPSVCPEVIDPVCGCDSETYENDCVRMQARVGLFHPGPCVTFCDGGSAGLCPEGTVCEGLPGHCDGTTGEGICVPIPQDCHEHDRPVCGCDGVTYRNHCERLAAGVRLDHPGRCGEICSGPDGQVSCGVGSFCEQRPGVCGDPTAPGICVEIPEFCTDEWDPVCGCDGKTYGNDCERMAAGVNKLHPGECEAICGGIAGLTCGPGEVCELPPGMCDAADLGGHCVALPDVCPEIFAPVCGCDGVTYGNECELLAAGAQIAHFGPCFEGCTPGAGECGPDDVCITLPGQCDGSSNAICVPRPHACPLVVIEVCGCDGITYSSPCAAVQAGASIAHEGPCEIGPCDPADPACNPGGCDPLDPNCQPGSCDPADPACPPGG
ncbi:MAG: Kazal-type serine protease inhibitor domain-containing protein [Candidatus Binatia bacterium]